MAETIVFLWFISAVIVVMFKKIAEKSKNFFYEFMVAAVIEEVPLFKYILVQDILTVIISPLVLLLAAMRWAGGKFK